MDSQVGHVKPFLLQVIMFIEDMAFCFVFCLNEKKIVQTNAERAKARQEHFKSKDIEK